MILVSNAPPRVDVDRFRVFLAAHFDSGHGGMERVGMLEGSSRGEARWESTCPILGVYAATNSLFRVVLDGKACCERFWSKFGPIDPDQVVIPDSSTREMPLGGSSHPS